MANNVIVTGEREILARLDAIGKELAGSIKMKALQVGAEVLKAGMERRAPRRKGRLAGSIVIEIEDDIAKIGPSKKAFYGRFQEYGTSRHPAQPFARPTLDEDGGAAVEAVKDELAKALR